MDPLHPIIPIAPTLPPITPAPMVGRVDRDGARSGADQDKRRRRRPPADSAPGQADLGYDGAEDNLDGGLHIDVTA